MSSVTSQAIIDAASDDSSDSDFFNKSLSIWRESNPNVELADEPLPLDLHTACSIGNYEAVESYIDSGTDLNVRNVGGYTALMYAAYIGHDSIVSLLLNAHADVNLTNLKDLTPLMLAASCGNESVCDCLQQAGADLEARDKRGWTALFHATYNGHQNVVKFLLDSGADINCAEPVYGHTPLMQAACQGHEIIVHTLLNQGADREIVSRLGDTAQSLAKKKAYHKIMTLLDSKSPNHSRLSRVTQPTSSDEERALPGLRRECTVNPRAKLNINEGPQALSRIMPPQGQRAGKLYRGPMMTAVKGALKQQETVAPIPPAQNSLSTLPGASAPVSSSTTRIMQVSPTLKTGTGRPANIHELLQHLNLLKYEPMFIEQDIDLEVFFTLSVDDLKEIGINTFGPRRKMINAIESWQKEHGLPPVLSSGAESNKQQTALLEQLQSELKEKTWQLNQAYTQLAGYHSNVEHYHKELEHEKNIRSLTESYLITEKAQRDGMMHQCKDVRQQCSKALRTQGKVKHMCQLLRARHEEEISIGSLPLQLQDTLNITDEATKSQISTLVNSPTHELWCGLQQALRDASSATALAIFSLDKLIKTSTEDS